MSSPDFVGLVRFLIGPFLESPEALSLDCELIPNRSKVWIRVAFKEEDRGRVFGRGGRNIQAIRTVVEATAKLVDWSAHLDVYGEPEHHATGEHEGNGRPSRSPDRSPPPRPRGRQR
ncbi:KH domain-containing protein [Pseudanabaena sp. FACHB-2040]|uniref:KH domain-containing protein n=1 Tax=Pseudanabaena sp. FACHB-2040 TaxID=2692859 RepID=UPI001687B5A9|nr:KH domain-containing protein [Pseudanabaena sp. FACHB-2040]MBD2260748.1 KH domain-containing protein [Pseudanabaena sp. FACHB-2040]